MDEAPKGSALQTTKELIAGSFGGIVQVLTGQPFDTIKVRLQTQPRENPLYSGIVDCASKTYKAEGLNGFYKGTLTPLIGVGACVSVQFGALESAKRYFADLNKSSILSINQLYMAGAASGIANSVLSCPIEHVRTRLQVQAGSSTKLYSGPVDFAKKVVKEYGVRALFKGQMITLARETNGYGFYFLAYEWLMQEAMKRNGCARKDIPLYIQCLSGAMAGYSMWFSIYPIDVVKSKIQTDSFDPKKAKYSSTLNCFKLTFKVEGLAGFYRGFWACMIRAAPVNAATFVAYEAAMN
ncbi:Mitochondrial carrier protein ymc2, partial [Nowakowskiella sp. JEL0078]